MYTRRWWCAEGESFLPRITRDDIDHRRALCLPVYRCMPRYKSYSAHLRVRGASAAAVAIDESAAKIIIRHLRSGLLARLPSPVEEIRSRIEK